MTNHLGTSDADRCRGRPGLTWFAAGIAIVLASCAPLSYDYYQPEAATGRIGPYRGACGGPPDYITFSATGLEWVEVRLHAVPSNNSETRKPILRLSIRKNIPFEFHFMPSVKTQKERAERFNEMNDRAIVIEATTDGFAIVRPDGERLQLPLGLPENGRKLVLKDSEFARVYEIPGVPTDSFDLEFPALAIGGSIVEIPRVHFYRTSKFAMTPINC